MKKQLLFLMIIILYINTSYGAAESLTPSPEYQAIIEDLIEKNSFLEKHRLNSKSWQEIIGPMDWSIFNTNLPKLTWNEKTKLTDQVHQLHLQLIRPLMPVIEQISAEQLSDYNQYLSSLKIKNMNGLLYTSSDDETLRSHASKVNLNHSAIAIFRATQTGYPEVVKSLIELKANPQAIGTAVVGRQEKTVDAWRGLDDSVASAEEGQEIVKILTFHRVPLQDPTMIPGFIYRQYITEQEAEGLAEERKAD